MTLDYAGPLIPLQDSGGGGYTKSLWVSSDGQTLCAKGVGAQPFPSPGTITFGIYNIDMGKQIAGIEAAPDKLGVWLRYDDATAGYLTFINGIKVYPYP